ncbi:hypothetical protein [Aquibium microcysteis]|uniref:hypothetical protein n=1 Tax=Aquibium microcysteis TaxID=675281 RepID=UPI00165D0291|nr:hypothetical protein [Aquibium microcysteis]
MLVDISRRLAGGLTRPADATMGVARMFRLDPRQASPRPILNASVADLVGFPGLSPFAASRHAVDGIAGKAALGCGKPGSAWTRSVACAWARPRSIRSPRRRPAVLVIGTNLPVACACVAPHQPKKTPTLRGERVGGRV